MQIGSCLATLAGKKMFYSNKGCEQLIHASMDHHDFSMFLKRKS